MGREIRRVPENWDHPKAIKTHIYFNEGYKTKEVFRPMYDKRYQDALIEFHEELAKWLKGCQYWQEGVYWRSWNNELIPKKEAFKEWMESIDEDRKRYGYGPDYRSGEYMQYQTGVCSWGDIDDDPPRFPNPEDYMPSGEWYQLFENVSEGTPLSPPFATTAELVDWLSKNKDYWGNTWTKEQAEAMVESGYAFSAVVKGGKVYNSQESLSVD